MPAGCLGHHGHMNDISRKKLERKRDGRMLAGVCAGVAEYFGVDVNVVRLVFAIS